MPPAWSVQAFERESSGPTSGSHATVVSDSPRGIARGEGAVGSLRDPRGSYAGTLLAVDESSRAFGGQMRSVPGITTAMDHPLGVELLGDENQLDRMETGKPFAQLRRAGVTTAAMKESLHRRNAELKSTTRRAACW